MNVSESFQNLKVRLCRISMLVSQINNVSDLCVSQQQVRKYYGPKLQGQAQSWASQWAETLIEQSCCVVC